MKSVFRPLFLMLVLFSYESNASSDNKASQSKTSEKTGSLLRSVSSFSLLDCCKQEEVSPISSVACFILIGSDEKTKQVVNKHIQRVNNLILNNKEQNDISEALRSTIDDLLAEPIQVKAAGKIIKNNQPYLIKSGTHFTKQSTDANSWHFKLLSNTDANTWEKCVENIMAIPTYIGNWADNKGYEAYYKEEIVTIFNEISYGIAQNKLFFSSNVPLDKKAKD